MFSKEMVESDSLPQTTQEFDTLAHPVTEKKISEPRVELRKPAAEEPIVTAKPSEGVSEQSRAKMYQLYNKYRHLIQERNDITTQKDELTRKVDLGELTTAQAHQKMVALTREASQLTEVIREISERLAELGHPHFK